MQGKKKANFVWSMLNGICITRPSRWPCKSTLYSVLHYWRFAI